MATHDFVKKAGSYALASALSLSFLGLTTAQASDSHVTLIEMGDLHGYPIFWGISGPSDLENIQQTSFLLRRISLENVMQRKVP